MFPPTDPGLPPPAFANGASKAPRLASSVARRVKSLPRDLLLLAIRGYQRVLSPLLPVVTLGNCGCRFAPTCSHYAAEAIRVHGAMRGTLLAVVRLLKCTPLHPGGLDPVPPPRRPSCRRLPPAKLSPGSLAP